MIGPFLVGSAERPSYALRRAPGPDSRDFPDLHLHQYTSVDAFADPFPRRAGDAQRRSGQACPRVPRCGVPCGADDGEHRTKRQVELLLQAGHSLALACVAGSRTSESPASSARAHSNWKYNRCGQPGFGSPHCKLLDSVLNRRVRFQGSSSPCRERIAGAKLPVRRKALAQIHCRRDFPYVATPSMARSIVLPASDWRSRGKAMRRRSSAAPLRCAVAQLETQGDFMSSMLAKTTHGRRAPAGAP
jgi:hypothetical protein